MQADREGRAAELADSYDSSALKQANEELLRGAAKGGGRASIATIGELNAKSETVTPIWWALLVLLKVSLCCLAGVTGHVHMHVHWHAA